MKAVILTQPETLIYDDIPMPTPKMGEARIQMCAASICGSDMLRVYRGAARVLPIVLGHEIAGIVEAVGTPQDAHWLGKQVAIAPLIPCMQCDSCLRGLYACCPNYSFIGSRIQGGFADYVVAPTANLLLLPDTADITTGALIEPITVGLHALARAGDIQGKSVGIVGVGSIGLLLVLAALWKGASQVIVTDVEETNLHAARQFGAAAALNSKNGAAAKEVMALTGHGVDIAIEVSGVPAGLNDAIRMCRSGGHIVAVGNQPLEAALPLHLIEHLMRQEQNLHGAWMSYSSPFPGHEWHDAVRMMTEQSAQLRQMFTHTTSLADLPAMFQRLQAENFPRRKVLIEYAQPQSFSKKSFQN